MFYKIQLCFREYTVKLILQMFEQKLVYDGFIKIDQDTYKRRKQIRFITKSPMVSFMYRLFHLEVNIFIIHVPLSKKKDNEYQVTLSVKTENSRKTSTLHVNRDLVLTHGWRHLTKVQDSMGRTKDSCCKTERVSSPRPFQTHTEIDRDLLITDSSLLLFTSVPMTTPRLSGPPDLLLLYLSINLESTIVVLPVQTPSQLLFYSRDDPTFV